MNVRPVEPRDREEWIAMRSALWPEGASDHPDEIDALFSGAGATATYVVEKTGRIIGFIELSVRSYAEGCTGERVPYIEGWYVLPEFRRRGAGRALVQAAEAWARSQGCSELASDALVDNR